MGDPKFPRRRYDTPSHPWKIDRITAENTLVRKYGLKNKREVWKAQTRLRTFRGTARQLLAQQRGGSPQAQKEAGQLIGRLARLGLLAPQSTLDDVLALDLENVLARRLQTIVYLKGLAGTPDQARQFIVHGHVQIGDRRVNVPSYFVRREEESLIQLNPKSAVADPAHPVRAKGDMPPAREERAPRGGPRGPPPPAVPTNEMDEQDVELPAPEGGEPA